MGAGRILAVDSVPSRLETARAQGAEVLDFNAEHPVEVVRQLTGGIGIDRTLDMVRSGEVDPVGMLTQHEPLGSAIDAYKAFDERQEGWIKVKLEPVG